MPSDQIRIIDQTKFTYSALDKAFGKQIKTIEDQGIKQVEALKALKLEENKEDIKSTDGIFPKDMGTNKIKNEIYEIKNGKIKLNEKTTHLIFSDMKQ